MTHWPNTLSTGSRLRIAVAVLAIALATALCGAGTARAQESYWITLGYSVVAQCQGSREPVSLKVAATNPSIWVQISGIVTCRDAGADFVYDVKFLRVSVNARSRSQINRSIINFDFLGMAIYRGVNQDTAVEYLAEPIRSIRGQLRTEDKTPIFFGNITFSVPKEAMAKAKYVTFYLSAQNTVFPFGFL